MYYTCFQAAKTKSIKFCWLVRQPSSTFPVSLLSSYRFDRKVNWSRLLVGSQCVMKQISISVEVHQIISFNDSWQAASVEIFRSAVPAWHMVCGSAYGREKTCKDPDLRPKARKYLLHIIQIRAQKRDLNLYENLLLDVDSLDSLGVSFHRLVLEMSWLHGIFNGWAGVDTKYLDVHRNAISDQEETSQRYCSFPWPHNLAECEHLIRYRYSCNCDEVNRWYIFVESQEKSSRI